MKITPYTVYSDQLLLEYIAIRESIIPESIVMHEPYKSNDILYKNTFSVKKV